VHRHALARRTENRPRYAASGGGDRPRVPGDPSAASVHHAPDSVARHSWQRAERRPADRPLRYAPRPALRGPEPEPGEGASRISATPRYDDAMNPKDEIDKLRADLERHNRLYYEGRPEISDYDFDQ